MTTHRRTLGHEPALDGIRGLAVLAVLLYHLHQADGIGWLQNIAKGGFLGVSAFFTLSGFLITSLLILEYESTGFISLGGFWSRRFRRLLPASLVTLAAVAVLTPRLGEPSQLKTLPGEIWATLGYSANWKFILMGASGDYSATFNGVPSPIKHFWSLAVEEQCYFVLPFIVAVAMRFGKSRRLVGAAFAAIVVGSTTAMIVLADGKYSSSVYFGTHTRVAELAVGALLAVVFAGRTRLRTAPTFVASSITGPLALGMILASWATTDLTQSTWLYRGGLTVHTLAVAVVILASVQPYSSLQRMLSIRPLQYVGRISYGLYLFHYPVFFWLRPEKLHLPPEPTALIQLAVTFTLAWLSYRFVEQPIRTGRLVTGRQRITVPAGAMASVALLAFVLPPADSSKVVAIGQTGNVVVGSTTQPLPGTTDAPPPVKVMVVGDSFALSLGLGLESFAQTTGQIATLNLGIVGCGFGRGGWNRGIGLEREWPDDCKNREQIFDEKMSKFDPDIVVMAGGMWDVTDRKLAGTNTWTRIGDPAYDQYLKGEFQHLIDFFANRGAHVVMATAPWFDPKYIPANYMGKGPYYEAQPGRSDKYNLVLRAAASTRPNDATVIDLAKWMQQDWPGGQFAPTLRIDGVHFTEESAPKVAQWMAPQLIGIERQDEDAKARPRAHGGG